MHKIVEGEKVKLRPASWGFAEHELRRRYQWSQDDELQYWSGSIPGARSYFQFKDTVMQRDWPPGGRRVSYAILTFDDQLVGMVSCYGIERDPRRDGSRGEIGIYLGEKPFWGHGLGTDAMITFLRHLFSDLGFESVYLHTYASNVRAQRSYQNVGFMQTEKRRRYSPRVGYHEEIRMEISRERFRRLQGLHRQASIS